MVTSDPLGPRKVLTASIGLKSLVHLSPILTIVSLTLRPALKAGVPSIGETTVSFPSLTVISIPMPVKLP